MKVHKVKIDQLKPAEYNPRELTESQEKDLIKSIEEFGMVEPIVVNNNEERENVIVGGHQRYKICKKLGLDEIPVVYVDLNVKKEKELNLRLNKNLGEWDWGLLANLEREMLESVGFNEYDLNEIFDLALTKEETVALDVPEPKREVVIEIEADEDLDKIEELIKKQGIKYKIRC